MRVFIVVPLALRPELPPADAVKVQVKHRLTSIVARIAGEPVAARLNLHFAGDPSSDRDQPTEGRLVLRLYLACRGQMHLGDNEEVDGCDPPRLVLGDVEGDHEIILVEHLRPNLAAEIWQ